MAQQTLFGPILLTMETLQRHNQRGKFSSLPLALLNFNQSVARSEKLTTLIWLKLLLKRWRPLNM